MQSCRLALFMITALLTTGAPAWAQPATFVLAGTWKLENDKGQMIFKVTEERGLITAIGRGAFKAIDGTFVENLYNCVGSRGTDRLTLDCAYTTEGGVRSARQFFSVVDKDTLSRDGAPFPVIWKRTK